MRVIAFDPGETTGFVIAGISEMPTFVQVEIEIVGEFRGLGEFFDICKKLFETHVSIVVIEDYIIYPNKARSHAGSKVLTARTIGHIEFAAFHFGFPHHSQIVFQTASMAKSRWPNERLTKYLGKVSHLSNHKIDAVRHLLTWVERKCALPLEVIS